LLHCLFEHFICVSTKQEAISAVHRFFGHFRVPRVLISKKAQTKKLSAARKKRAGHNFSCISLFDRAY